MLWQFFSLPGIENGIEYRYFSRYRIEVRNSSIVTTLTPWCHICNRSQREVEEIKARNPAVSLVKFGHKKEPPDGHTVM